MKKIGRGSDQAMIRLPDGMRDRLKAAGEANGRSMNAEIVARLEESLEIDAGDVDENEIALRALKMTEEVTGMLQQANKLMQSLVESNTKMSSVIDFLQKSAGDPEFAAILQRQLLRGEYSSSSAEKQLSKVEKD